MAASTPRPAETRDRLQRPHGFPRFVDMHTHLDKGHIWPRTPNPDGTFDGRPQHRRRRPRRPLVRRRCARPHDLRCAAYAHGTRAIRTHLDSIPPQDAISWPVFEELRADWKGRIDLQAVCLVGADGGRPHEGAYRATADLVEKAGGALGMVTYPIPDLEPALKPFFAMATRARARCRFSCR
jgi:cytosine deaminase